MDTVFVLQLRCFYHSCMYTCCVTFTMTSTHTHTHTTANTTKDIWKWVCRSRECCSRKCSPFTGPTQEARPALKDTKIMSLSPVAFLRPSKTRIDYPKSVHITLISTLPPCHITSPWPTVSILLLLSILSFLTCPLVCQQKEQLSFMWDRKDVEDGMMACRTGWHKHVRRKGELSSPKLNLLCLLYLRDRQVIFVERATKRYLIFCR